MRLLIILLLFTSGVYANKPDSVWMNQKFSMFIHWGLYSELGGVWDGQPVTSGYSEQIQAHAGIFGDWYAAVANRFMPLRWNADSVVALAKQAGMKSIVFTSKHHDGFCMYHSRYTDYNIVDATPFARDVMKELAEACRRQGMRFGVYFSLIDWHFPQAYPISSHNADPLTPEHYAFNRKQVTEIMTEYGKISEIWFDMGSLTPEQSRGLYALVDSLQPDCMISGRLGNDCSDFSVMADNEYPDYKIGVPWQTAASFFEETWGYRSWQERGNPGEKADEKIRSLVKVVSRGGNYLLNIGPEGDGSVVPFEKDVLEKMGKWLKKYGEGIYGTQPNPFEHQYAWQDITVKGNRMYLFVDPSVALSCVCLDGLRGNILSASCIGGDDVAFGREKGEWQLYGQGHRPADSPLEVICLELENGWQIEPLSPYAGERELMPLHAFPEYAYSSIDYYTGFQSTIAYNWVFKSRKTDVRPLVYYTDQEAGRKIRVGIDGQEREILLEGGKLAEKRNVKGVKWGNVYSKPSGSVFGSRPQVGTPVDTADGWAHIPGFVYGKRYEKPARERSSILVLQEIGSDKKQVVPVEIGSGDGIQVYLNGSCLTAHISSRKATGDTELVLLPLEKGRNQLLLKVYNRFGKKSHYSISPVGVWNVYELSLPSYPLGSESWHRCRVRAADAPAKNSPMRLNNLRIKL